MARPHFEPFNKAVLTAENEIIKARQNLIATQQKRGWLTKLFIAFGTDEEAQRFDLHKNSYLQALDRLERELIEICPKAYSKPKPRPSDLAYVFGDMEQQKRARGDELKYLHYDIHADILECEAQITELKPKAEAAARADENRRLRNERQETKKARIEAVLYEARSNGQRIALLLPRNHPCPYCGGALGDSPHADHIHPVAKGGHSTGKNMVYVCRECNALKSDSTLTAFIAKEGRDLARILDALRQLGKDV